jgi:uncharacterized protein (DUF58 family)
MIFAVSVPVSAIFLAILGAQWLSALVFPAMCLVFLAADLSMIIPIKSLTMEINGPDRILLGQKSDLVISIQTLAQTIKPTIIEMALEADGPAEPEATRAQSSLKSGETIIELPITPKRRGLLNLKKVWFRYSGPLGLCRLVGTYKINKQISCLPNTHGLHQSALMFFNRTTESGQKSLPFFGQGSEFDSLMDFARGMDNRFIDWKHSARHRKLLAKEFRQERNHQIVLGFDTGRLMTEPIDGLPKIDHFIRAGLLLAWVSLLGGDMVGASGFDLVFRSFLRPGRGQGFFNKIQHFTSQLNYRTEETNFTVGLAELAGRLPHRSLIIIFTEFIDTITASFLIEGLSLLAKKHMIIFVTMPDPLLTHLRDDKPETIDDLAAAVVAEGFQRDRAIVLEKVARLGAFCVDLPPRAMGPAILNRYLLIKQRGLL